MTELAMGAIVVAVVALLVRVGVPALAIWRRAEDVERMRRAAEKAFVERED